MTTRHPCPLCGAPLTYDGTHDGVEAWQCTANAAHVHVAGDCCDAATDAERAALNPPSWHEGAYWPPKAARDAVEGHRSHAAGPEGQGATQEVQDATEAAERRVERYAEAIHNTYCGLDYEDCDGINLVDDEAARAVIAVADQEHHQRLAEIDAFAQTEWRRRAEAAEARVAELEATVAEVRALHAGHLHDPVGTGEWSGSCLGCGETWPCQTAAILGPDQP